MTPNPWLPTRDDVLPCLVTGAMGAWLWWRNGQLGVASPLIGALIGVGAGYLCRNFC